MLRSYALLCDECQKLLELLDPKDRCPLCFSEQESQQRKICFRCSKKQTYLDGAAAAFDYAGPAACLVKKMKYSNQPFLAKGLSAYLAAQLIQMEWPLPDLIVPAPTTFTHWIQRGYNQSLLLAEELGSLIERPVADIIYRAIGDYSQAGLSKAQRLSLHSQHFSLKKNRNIALLDKRVLLIDDVMTTGTTLGHCASVLMQESPAKIFALTICKSI